MVVPSSVEKYWGLAGYAWWKFYFHVYPRWKISHVLSRGRFEISFSMTSLLGDSLSSLKNDSFNRFQQSPRKGLAGKNTSVAYSLRKPRWRFSSQRVCWTAHIRNLKEIETLDLTPSVPGFIRKWLKNRWKIENLNSGNRSFLIQIEHRTRCTCFSQTPQKGKCHILI